MHRRYEREEKKETIPIHQFAGLRRRRHVDPRAASGGGAWGPCAATSPADPRRLPCSSVFLGGLFCNFEIVKALFG